MFAQSFRANIKQYTEKDGLSSNEVLAIIKDARGVIWIATKYGLNRFDGKQFKVFTTQNGLFSNHIDELYSDNQHLWLLYKETVTEGGDNIKNIEILDIRTHKIRSFASCFGKKIPFEWNQVKYCKRMGSELFFELENHQRFLYKADKGFEEKKYLPYNEKVLSFTKNGDCWLTKNDNGGIYLIKRDKTGAQVGKSFFFATTIIHFDCETNEETCHFSVNVKAAVEEKALHVEIPKNAESYTTFRIENFDSWYANTLFLPKLNLLWYSAKNILAAYTPDKQLILYNDTEAKLLNTSTRQTLIEDKVIWLCSYAGFYRVELAKNHFTHLYPNTQFRSIVRIKDNFYMSSNYEIIVFNPTKKQENLPLGGLSSTLSADSSLWAANNYNLYRYYPAQKRTQKYTIPYKDPWAMQEDSEGNLWISQNGIIRFNPQTQQIDSTIYGDYKELKESTVYHFFPFQKERWYLCTTSGLYEFNPLTKKILTRHSMDSPTPFRLPANDFRHLYFDKKENVFWLVTGQNGLIRWNPKTNKSQTFTFYSITANLIHAVYADEFGFLWLSTEGGIIQFHKKTHTFRIYTTKDGLPSNEYNRISHFQDTDGTLFFGGVNGVVSFHPKNFQTLFYEKEKATPFVVEVFQYLGKTNQLENVTTDFEKEKRIYLQPNDRFFTLTMGLKEYEQSDVARYFYKMKGETGEWTEANSNQITLGRLPYGNQTLLVKALLANGQFSETVAEIPLYVARPFYATWWFIVLIIALSVLGVFWRINILRKQNLQLEEEIARRTEKIREDKIIIEKQAAELQQLDELKTRFFANISHELRTPITLILNPLNYLLKSQKWEKENEKRLLMAQRNSQRLLRLVNEILDLTKLEAATLNIQQNEVDILGFVQRTLAEFESFAVRQGVSLRLEHSLIPKTQVTIDLKKVETILYNFIGNALKFTPNGGHIRVKIGIQNTDLQIEVTDTGRGIQAEDLPHIFDRFYQSKTNGTSEGGSGLGLALSRELAHLLKGEIWAESEWGKGSSFFFKLPQVVLAHHAAKNIEIENIQIAENKDFNSNIIEALTPLSLEENPLQKAKYNLLLVEDNADLQDYIADILRAQYEVTVKSNGKEAFEYLESLENAEHFPNLIISDVMMPQMDGYQLLQLLKAAPKYQKLPVIMLTARAGLEDKLKALQIGVDDYLTKPFVEVELLARIENLLRNADLRKQAWQEEPEMENENSNESANLHSQWLREVEQMVYENMAKPNFSIETLSEILGISRQTFNTHIKKEVGMTAVQYLQEVKLHHAKKMLENGEVQSVKNAAENVGIKDLKYFSRLFKTRFGRSPSEYLM